MFNEKTIKLIVPLIIVVFMVSGCNNEQVPMPDNEPVEIVPATVISTEVVNSDVQDEGYPSPELEIQTDVSQSSYPGSDLVETPFGQEIAVLTQPALPLQLEPSEIGATIGGVLINENTQQAPPESLVYLGNMKYTETGFPVVSLNRQTAPLSVLSPNGAFIIQNVAPGDYALVFFTPDYSSLVEDSEEMSVIFTVEEGDVLDLGTMLIGAN